MIIQDDYIDNRINSMADCCGEAVEEHSGSALNSQIGGDHYKNLKIQPVQYIYANNIPFVEGCIIKYATRWKNKGGIKDLEKIIHFTKLLIEMEK